MARIFTRKNIIIGILVQAAVVAFLAFYTFKGLSGSVKQTRLVEKSLQSLRVLENLMDDMQDIETGQRGFVISLDTLFLDPYYSSLRELGIDTVAIIEEIENFPERRESYKDLLAMVKRKVQLTKQTVLLVREGKQDEAEFRISVGEGRTVMDSIRSQIFQFEQTDRQVLLQSNQKRKNDAISAVKFMLAICVVLAIGLLWLAWRLLREEKLRRRHESQITELARLTEQTSDAIFSTDNKGVILTWNKGAEAMTGYSASETIGKFAPTITRSGRTSAEINFMAAAISQEGSMMKESVIYGKDGKEIFCLGSITKLKDSGVGQEGYVVTLRDITDRKMNEKLLTGFNQELAEQVDEKTALIQNIVGRIRDGFYSLNNNREITYINQFAAKVMGSTPEELTGRNLWEAYPAGVQSKAFDLIETAFRKQEQKELEFFFEPHQAWYAATVYPSSNGLSVYFKNTTEQKKAEDAVKRINERFDLISRTTNDAIWEWNLETGEMWGNEMHQQLYGLTHADPVPSEKEWENRIHPDDRDRLLKRQEAALASLDHVFITEYRFRKENNGYRYIYDRCYIVRNEEGKAIKMMGNMMDVTEQKLAEEKIRVSEEQYRVLVENAVEALVVLDAESQKFVMVSRSAETLFKMERSALLQVGPVLLSPEYQADGRLSTDMAREKIENAIAGGKPIFEWIHLDANREPISCEITLVRLPSKDRILIRGSIVDITERKKAELALRESEEKIRHILSSSVDEFYVIDRNYRVTLVNEVAKMRLKQLFDAEVGQGTEILKIFPQERREIIRGNYEKMFKGARVEYEFTIDIDGRPFWRRVSYSPVTNKEGEIVAGFISTTDVTEKRKAEEDIIKMNARFQLLSKATTDIVWDLNFENNMIWWNDNYYTSLGYKKVKEHKAFQDWLDHIHPEDVDRVKTVFMEATRGTALSWRDEYRYRKADGSYLYVLDRGYIMRNEKGQPNRMIGSMVDMTPIYAVQKKVIESEYRLRTILDTDPECIKLMDEKGMLIDINKAGLQMVEAGTVEELAGESLLKVVAEPFKKQTQAQITAAYRGLPGRFEFEMNTLKGKKRWCEISLVPFRNAEGNIISVLGVTRDMTENLEARNALIRNEEKYRTLVEQAADAIALYDATGRILDVNSGASNLLGYSKEELMEMRLDQVLTSEETLLNPVRYDILQEGKSTVKQRKMRRKDGVVVETEVSSQQLPDGRFLSVIRDLTDRIKAEQELQRYYTQLKELNSYLQNVREEERSNIAREIHDELGQQLTVLKMDISWVYKKVGEQSPELKERLQGLIEMVDNTVRSVRRISSELRPSMLDDLGLPAAMEWHAQEFMKRTGISIETHIDAFDRVLPGKVAITVFRVFQESLTNVARHANANKVVVTLLLQSDPDCLLLTVKDDGRGFLMKDIESRKTLGILGMKERIAIINGKYSIKSQPGKGTLVSINVPLPVS